jgi:hypothetical protein
MFTLGQTIKLKLPLQGVVEAQVIATGGGNTTIAPKHCVVDGMEYPTSTRLRCFTDEELKGLLA